MLKKSLFVVALVAMLAVMAQAGEYKAHNWPTNYQAMEITTIPVKMDIGYWVRILDQDKLGIKLNQNTTHEYQGCCDMKVQCNFLVELSASISKASGSPVDGKWSAKINDSGSYNLDSPGGTVTVCAFLKEANLTASTGGQNNVHVANVTIKVRPAS
jgi:hypothetical protein